MMLEEAGTWLLVCTGLAFACGCVVCIIILRSSDPACWQWGGPSAWRPALARIVGSSPLLFTHAMSGAVFSLSAGAVAERGSLPSFRLELFSVLWRCLLRCWEEGVFLAALVHRFWKLTLQV